MVSGKVVTLLGWAGASEKNIGKFAKIYEDKGYKTIQYTAPVYYAGWGTKNSRDVTELSKILSELPDLKLIFHLFSMNGVLTFCSLCLQYPDLKIMERSQGIFFDSGPIHNINADWKIIRAYATVMQHFYDSKKINTNFIINFFYEVSKYFAIVKNAYTIYQDMLLIKSGLIPPEKVSAYFYLQNHPNLPKVLSFIYSDADSICDAEIIHEFETALEKSGNRDVISSRFKDSQHVEHFRKYPKQYTEQIFEFLRRIEEPREIYYRTSKL